MFGHPPPMEKTCASRPPKADLLGFGASGLGGLGFRVLGLGVKEFGLRSSACTTSKPRLRL